MQNLKVVQGGHFLPIFVHLCLFLWMPSTEEFKVSIVILGSGEGEQKNTAIFMKFNATTFKLLSPTADHGGDYHGIPHQPSFLGK